jgi:hypothetical protein
MIHVRSGRFAVNERGSWLAFAAVLLGDAESFVLHNLPSDSDETC